MLAQLSQKDTAPSETELARMSHILFVLVQHRGSGSNFPLPRSEILDAILKRRNARRRTLTETPVAAELGQGGLGAWVIVDPAKPRFDQQTAVRKALQLLLEENPASLAIAVFGDDAGRRLASELVVYGAWLNGTPLPVHKKKDRKKPLKRIVLYGYHCADGFALARAQAEGNLLARSLTVLPPNELTPARYRERIKDLAEQNSWGREEFDMKRLRAMGAGAFVAVAQGSAEDDAAIVRLSYRHKRAHRTVALVGKGICFDTGGHNLKPAKHMYGMHEDMNGSAVCLGILLAATALDLPIHIDCWLAIAQNQIGPRAYKQNDVVTALNGTTIEIVHTDAEGRMVLADALALAAREKPTLIVDFATLTGSMHTALGSRYSGIFSNRAELLARAVEAGARSGERVNAFPLDADYDPALDSKVADIKQCTPDSAADHILAARFLSRFVAGLPWLHLDLSASNCEGGLGAVASEVTGFGVAWAMSLLRSSIDGTQA
jgi:leucyl aminopeptidase